jgi:hypothetical protein
MKRLFLWLGVGTLIWLGCEKQTGTGATVIDSPDLQLAAVDAGCTDVLLKITAGHQRYSGPLLLLQNDEPVDTLNYGGADTLLWRQNLAINTTYNWRIQWQASRGQTAEAAINTLDTISYNYSWETFEFGFGRSSSHLADVAIINENNIWAVGEILHRRHLYLRLPRQLDSALQRCALGWQYLGIETNSISNFLWATGNKYLSNIHPYCLFKEQYLFH